MTAYYETTRLLSDYGMSSDPFNTIHPLDQGTRYFWQEKLVPTDVPMIVVTGITGVGKSLYTAEYSHENERETSWLFASKGMLPSNLLKAIVQRFEMGVSLAQLTLQKRKSAVAQAFNATDTKYCLIIDDAHILPDETLYFISEFLRDVATNLQIVLVGLPVLSDKVSIQIGESQDDFNILYKVIAPMNKTQVRAYITELMYASGLKKRLKIADSTINKIYEASSGVARDVNKVSTSYLKEILIQPKFEPVMPTSEQMFEAPEVSPNKQIAAFFLMATAVVMMGVIYNVHHLYQANNNFQLVSRPDLIINETLQDNVAAATTSEQVDVVLGQPAIETTGTTQVSTTTNLEQPTITPVTQVAKDNDKVVSQIKKAAATLPKQTDLKSRITADTDYFMQQQGYAIQLAAAKGLSEVNRWVKTFPKETRVVLALRNNKPFYLLLTGPYKSMAEARQSTTQLTDKQKHFKPWVRSLKQLHQDIAAYRDIESNPVIELT